MTKSHLVSIKLTEEEYALLLKDAMAARRKAGPQAAWIVVMDLQERYSVNELYSSNKATQPSA